MATKSGFVSILGRANAGKSTLLNALLGTKLAIVADKPQTTRTSIQGVLTMPGVQIVFIDTPGIHRSNTLFNKRMMQVVRESIEGRDLLLYLVDVTEPFSEQDEMSVSVLQKCECPVLLLLTKVDRLRNPEEMLPLIEKFKASREFVDYLPISAKTGAGLDRLREAIIERLPEGPAFYPKDYLTDQPERFLAAELIREKVLRETRQEVPHAVAVVVEKWEDKKKLLRISATIFVERDGQKGIIIGSKGSMLKKVGTAAREDMEGFFGRKVFLELFVKVQPGWRENPEFLTAIDWRSIKGISTPEEE
jgi:GTP-binding protein Era